MAEPIQETEEPQLDFDAIVVGTGFAGAVTACRLTEARKRICVLERGRRFEKDDFPVFPPFDIPSVESDERPGCGQERLTPDFSRLFWTLGQGLWDFRDLDDVIVAQAAGFGGGSLFYANVHLRPPAEVFDETWPKEYRGTNLGPYFDLAAFMLDVKPYSDKAPKLAKTAQLERAAAKLGRKCFRPPLAVNFGSPKPEMEMNRFRRMQGRCQLRGDCCFGCGAMAKNTLDLNYLALTEDAKCGGVPLADIRTLSEVVFIERIDGGYKVEYRDLLSGVPEELVSVTAEYVFLCAGAVNSTELLLRSWLAGKVECPSEDLGKGFYPNADAFGVAFDCRDLQEAHRGPTITSALLYDDEKHWLLFQDGGMPTQLEPLLGLFRSPLWLGRNRFWEHEQAPPPSSRHPRMGYATLPFQSWTDALGSLTPSAIQSKWPLLPKQLRDALPVHRQQLLDEILADADPFVADFMAETAHTVLGDLESFAKRLLDSLRGSDQDMGDKPTFERLMERLRGNLGLPEGVAMTTGTDGVKLVEDIMRLGVQLVWGSQGDLVRAVAEELLERLVPGNEKLPEQTSHLLQWALDFRLSEGRTALLLCMGQDSRGGSLSLVAPDAPPPGSTVTGQDSGAAGILVSVAPRNDGWAREEASGTLVLARLSGTFISNERLFVGHRAIGKATSGEIQLTPPNPLAPPSTANNTLKQATQRLGLVAIHFGPLSVSPQQKATVQRRLLRSRLRARLPGPLETPERTTQEQMLRDIANKGWGGELRTDPFWPFMRRRVTVHSQGGCPMGTVTKADGQVIGSPGLYVMDAAAFPRSVGVNPSATITAIAEYKVEQFIQNQLEWTDWRTREFKCALDWALPRRNQIDPLSCIPRWTDPPQSKPVGITFKEAMVGDCWDPNAPQNGPRYEIETAFCARIDDLSCFLERHISGKAPEIALEGRVEVQGATIPPVLQVRPGVSHIRLSRVHGAPGGRKTHRVDYHLVLDSNGSSYLLEGGKTIRDDERLDVWEDATTVKFELKQNGRTKLKGVLRVPASTFFGEQVPSFEATNTKDPVRRSWALAAFAKVFFGHLVDVYVPELDRVVDVAKSIVERTHV